MLVYDIRIQSEEDEERLRKVCEIAKQFLFHVEYSVFYGEINENNLNLLINKLKKIMKDEDSIIIYKFNSKKDIRALIKLDTKEIDRIL